MRVYDWKIYPNILMTRLCCTRFYPPYREHKQKLSATSASGPIFHRPRNPLTRVMTYTKSQLSIANLSLRARVNLMCYSQDEQQVESSRSCLGGPRCKFTTCPMDIIMSSSFFSSPKSLSGLAFYCSVILAIPILKNFEVIRTNLSTPLKMPTCASSSLHSTTADASELSKAQLAALSSQIS